MKNLDLASHPMTAELGECHVYYSQSEEGFLSTKYADLGLRIEGKLAGMESITHAMYARHKMLEVMINLMIVVLKKDRKVSATELALAFHGCLNMMIAITRLIATYDEKRREIDPSLPKWYEEKDKGQGMGIKWFYQRTEYAGDHKERDRHDYTVFLIEEAKDLALRLGSVDSSVATEETTVDMYAEILNAALSSHFGTVEGLEEHVAAFCKKSGYKGRKYNNKLMHTSKNLEGFKTYLSNLNTDTDESAAANT